jgi:hypothetical protein
MKVKFDSIFQTPSEKQFKVIGFIEWNLQDSGVKFTGSTKQDAQKFIAEHIEDSRRVRHEAIVRASTARIEREIYNFTHRSTPNHGCYTSSGDIRCQQEEARQKRYEEYIEDASWAYVNDDDDGFGGFAAERAARRAMPYDEFCRWHDWGD